jgi:GNAT superfamily N-acetyltransferase
LIVEREITIWHLEMKSPDELRAKRVNLEHFVVTKAELPAPEFQRFLYTAVGGDWYWMDRLPWTFDQWRAWVNRPELHTFVAYRHGTPAGYYNLEQQANGDVEIVYFGLLPQFAGQGLGGALLTDALENAWALGAQRVHVNTCSLDGPAALTNYQARGLKIFKTETKLKDLPDQPIGPWAGSR